jgi:hypothetical protein
LHSAGGIDQYDIVAVLFGCDRQTIRTTRQPFRLKSD